MAEQTIVQGRFAGFTNIPGIELLVVEAGGVEYVPLKPLAKLAGIGWRGTRRGMKTSLFNITLYEPARIAAPLFSDVGRLCIRKDRVFFFIARIDTDRMRAQGRVAAADALLKHQIQWAALRHECSTA